MQTGISRRIEEKEMERDSFEFEISNVDVKQIDDGEKQVVLSSLLIYLHGFGLDEFALAICALFCHHLRCTAS